ncbi:RrF2 family transcriptional regulator [Clostridium perfringens]|uniref:RrF2 family transcriptional regulator n=1 Tax=Clostridium perfringens TaxID=1502 RepID=UPI0039EC1F16
MNNEGIVDIDEMQERFSLAKNPNEITIFDIINVMENTMKINFCLEEDEYCSRFATENCPVRKFYCELQYDIESSLKSKTIHDLIST